MGVDGHRARPLGRAAHADQVGRVDSGGAHGPGGGRADGRPPLLGVLFGAAAVEQVEGDRLGGMGHDPSRGGRPPPPSGPPCRGRRPARTARPGSPGRRAHAFSIQIVACARRRRRRVRRRCRRRHRAEDRTTPIRARTSRAITRTGARGRRGPRGTGDPVRHLESGRLAEVLDVADDLPGQAPAPQVVVEGQVEGEHLGTVPGHGEPGLGPHPQLHLLGAQLDRPVGQLDHHRPARGELGGGGRAVHGGHGGPQLLDPLADPRTRGA